MDWGKVARAAVGAVKAGALNAPEARVSNREKSAEEQRREHERSIKEDIAEKQADRDYQQKVYQEEIAVAWKDVYGRGVPSPYGSSHQPLTPEAVTRVWNYSGQQDREAQARGYLQSSMDRQSGRQGWGSSGTTTSSGMPTNLGGSQ
jgi:hypothetical protein